MSSLCVSLTPCRSIHFLHVPPTCIDKFSWNLKFDVGFLNAFLLEKYYIKIAFWNVHDGRIMHRLWCSGIFLECLASYCAFISSFFADMLTTKSKVKSQGHGQIWVYVLPLLVRLQAPKHLLSTGLLSTAKKKYKNINSLLNNNVIFMIFHLSLENKVSNLSL